jgi:hypothetical protein
VELIKGSLNTFLNAFTYPDRTCYPVASTNLQARMAPAPRPHPPACAEPCVHGAQLPARPRQRPWGNQQLLQWGGLAPPMAGAPRTHLTPPVHAHICHVLPPSRALPAPPPPPKHTHTHIPHCISCRPFLAFRTSTTWWMCTWTRCCTPTASRTHASLRRRGGTTRQTRRRWVIVQSQGIRGPVFLL